MDRAVLVPLFSVMSCLLTDSCIQIIYQDLFFKFSPGKWRHVWPFQAHGRKDEVKFLR